MEAKDTLGRNIALFDAGSNYIIELERINTKLREENAALKIEIEECKKHEDVMNSYYRELRARIEKLEAVVECARNLSNATHNVDLADEFDDLDLVLEELDALGYK